MEKTITVEKATAGTGLNVASSGRHARYERYEYEQHGVKYTELHHYVVADDVVVEVGYSYLKIVWPDGQTYEKVLNDSADALWFSGAWEVD